MKLKAHLRLAAEEWRGKYDSVGSFHEGFARVERDGKCGFVDKTGKEVVPPKYDGVRGFSEGLAVVKLKRKWGFINTKDEVVVPLTYD